MLLSLRKSDFYLD